MGNFGTRRPERSTYEELIGQVSQMSGLSRRQCRACIDTLLELAADELMAGRAVSLPGFGLLEPVLRRPRKARNLVTGEMLEIPARRSVVFRPWRALQDRVEAQSSGKGRPKAVPGDAGSGEAGSGEADSRGGMPGRTAHD